MRMNERVAGIIEALKVAYPDALCALHYQKDYELMIAVRLSAQCTDARVNLVTPALFERFPTLDDFADADIAEVENMSGPAVSTATRHGTLCWPVRCSAVTLIEKCRTIWKTF